MRQSEPHAVEETRQAILEQLTAVRDDLARHRSRTLRLASTAWLDLAIGYARDVDSGSMVISRRNGAQCTLAQLDAELEKCAAEELRLREMLDQFDLRIALFAQGALPAVPARPGPKLLVRAIGAMRAAFPWRLGTARPSRPSGAHDSVALAGFETEHA
jgi:hypothetical protein